MKQFIKLLKKIINASSPNYKVMQKFGSTKGVELINNFDCLDFFKNNKIIRINKQHEIYYQDIIDSFDYYYDAVKPITIEGVDVVDYSSPRYHDVRGFDLMPVFFPSFSESLSSINQYLNFANLAPGSVVIDLGAYSGLTSILFKELVGDKGKVMSMEADIINLDSIKRNFNLYEKITGNKIYLLSGAIWNHCNGLDFSSEGNMGSSAAEILPDRGKNLKVKSYTLSKIAEIFEFESIEFIKIDIEGAENRIFDNADDFFDKYNPHIIIETHMIGDKSTSEKCIYDLSKYGYRCKIIDQPGVSLNLLECLRD